jgi:drug/metabolite transporter (DMT)-like permease
MGALNNLLPFSLIFWGQTQIASGLASILNSTTPLFTVVLAHFFTRDERLTTNRLTGVLFGLLGVAVMLGPDALYGLHANMLAQIAVLGAAICYAFAGIFGRRFRGAPPLVTAAGQVGATSVMMLPIVLIADRPWTLPMPSLQTFGAVVALALLSTALAYVIYFRILAVAGATNLLLVTFLIPVSALLLGMSILGERLDLRHFGGMALIAFGLAAIDGRPLRYVKNWPTHRSSQVLVESCGEKHA